MKTLKTTWAIALTSIVTTLIIFASFLFTALTDHSELIKQAYSRSHFLTSIVNQRITKSVENSKFILSLVQDRLLKVDFARLQNDPSSHMWLKNLASKLPEPGSIYFFDTNGKMVINSNSQEISTHDYTDRDYFKKHMKEGIPFYIGRMIKGRLSNTFHFTISQLAYNAKNEIMGILLITVDVFELEKLIDIYSYYPSSTIAIYKGNGDLVFRQGMNDSWLNLNISNGPLFKEHLKKSPKGEWEVNSIVDGTYRYYTYDSIPALDLVVMSGVPRKEVLKNWTNSILVSAGLATFSAVIVILLNLFIFRYIKVIEASAIIRSKMAHNVSHEIRNPMNAILGYSELASESDDLITIQSYIARIKKASHLLLGIVNDILDFSAIENGKIQIRTERFRIASLINDLKSIIDQRATAKGIPFRVFVDPKIPETLLGDSQRLTQVLNNLCSNAIKFTNVGEVTLRIDIATRNEQEISLSFSVIDTGVGIAAKDLQKLFQPFSQVDSSNQSKEKGTGLGLKIAQDLVNLMGGIIHVTSKEGEGSVFNFTIPFSA